jgi:hypothetical protein
MDERSRACLSVPFDAAAEDLLDAVAEDLQIEQCCRHDTGAHYAGTQATAWEHSARVVQAGRRKGILTAGDLAHSTQEETLVGPRHDRRADEVG